jgi:predicted nucleic acid-binding protein
MAAAIVFDASVALAWFLEGDSEQQRRKARRIGELIASEPLALVVPSVWHVEVGSALVRDRRGRRLGAEALVAALSRLEQLPIETRHLLHTPRQVVKLAERCHLAGYDALYLDLATP